MPSIKPFNFEEIGEHFVLAIVDVSSFLFQASARLKVLNGLTWNNFRVQGLEHIKPGRCYKGCAILIAFDVQLTRSSDESFGCQKLCMCHRSTSHLKRLGNILGWQL